MTTIIYGLVDPRTNVLRYIGKTTQPLRERLWRHISSRELTKTATWVKGIVNAGLRPVIFEIETVQGDWEEAEQFWIANYRSLGASLTNMTGGGLGAQSRVCKSSTKKKLSSVTKGKSVPLERRARIAASLSGRQIPADVREKISSALRGKAKPPRTVEHAQRIAEKNKGRTQSPEERAARSAGMKAYAATAVGSANLKRASAMRKVTVS